MKHSRILVTLLCVAIVAPAALAQRSSGSASATSAVMELIPAGAAAYVVVPNVKAATTAVDAFLKEHEVYDFTAADFERDRKTLRHLRASEAQR